MKKLFFFFNYRYLPILTIYFGLIFVFGANELVSDRLRYWLFSENLLNGFYFDPKNTLWNGPGYPIFIALLRSLGFGWEIIVYTNAVLLYLSVLFFEKIISKFIEKPIYITYLFAFWEPVLLYQYLPHLMTEVFVIFLISILVWVHLSEIKHKKIILGFILSLIILTKVIFFYVIAFMIFLSLTIKIFRKKKYILPLVLSIVFCTPYLFYTYNLTNKIFYFSDAGGSSLYWMSEPSPFFKGDWNGGYGYSQNNPNIATKTYNEFLKQYSWPIQKELEKLNWIEKDEALKKLAIYNIRENKLKYFKNWINNLGRLFFGYPFTFHTPNWQHILVTFKQSFHIVGLFIVYLISIMKFRNINVDYLFLIVLFSIYIFGVSLLSSYPRFLFITNIITWVYAIYIYKNFLKISLK